VSTPLRIFLSYGHDAKEILVRRIKADLEKRGHDVWFDKSEIKFGEEWRRSITEGIERSNKFLVFLSEHSTRDPSVWRDEIAIALGVKGGNIQTILVESEAEVQPPVNSLLYHRPYGEPGRESVAFLALVVEGGIGLEQWVSGRVGLVVALFDPDISLLSFHQ
jgi:hypothetical protein